MSQSKRTQRCEQITVLLAAIHEIESQFQGDGLTVEQSAVHYLYSDGRVGEHAAEDLENQNSLDADQCEGYIEEN